MAHHTSQVFTREQLFIRIWDFEEYGDINIVTKLLRGGIYMIINHNIGAMMACRYMNIHLSFASKAMQRISSGRRINSAADDPAGLAISEGMKAQIRGLQQASRNVQDGISVIQVADGALNETNSMLQRLRELAVQATNGTLSPQDRKAIQVEVDQLTSGINRIATDTQFNTINIIDPSNGKYDAVDSQIKLQIGANSGQVMAIPIGDMKSNALNISGTAGAVVTSKDGSVQGTFSTTKCSDASGYALDLSTPENANAAIKIYSDAISQVSSLRSTLGATQNTLEHRINYLDNTAENLTAAESRIVDADIAKEMIEYSKHNLLYQVCQTMFIQANKQSESIIELLKSL